MWARDLGVLIYMDLMKFKNGIKYGFTNPIKALKTIYGFLIPIFFILLPVLLNNKVSNKNIRTFLEYETLINVRGGITLILILILAITIRILSDDYIVGGFKNTDVQYLFPSPIGERTILFYSMIRSMMSTIIGYAYMWFICLITFFKKSSVNINNMIFSFVGVMILIVIYKSLGYFLYSIKIRFNAKALISYLGKAILVFALIYIVYIGYKLYLLNFDFNELFKNYIIGKVPIINDFEKIITLPIVKENVNPYSSLMVILAIAIIFITLFLLFSVNYYEDVAEKLDGLAEEINEAKENSKDLNKASDNAYKNVKENVSSKDLFGEWAFSWKNNLLDKKKNMLKKRIIIAIVILACGGLITRFIYTFTGQDGVVLMIALFLCFFQNTSKASQLLKSELKSMYIYLLPGSAVRKSLAVIIKPISLGILYRILFFIPILIFLPSNKLYTLLVMIDVVLFSIMVTFKDIAIILSVPKDEDDGGPIGSLISFILKGVPVGISLFVLTKGNKYVLSAIILMIITILEIVLLRFICEKLFGRMEY